MNLPIRSFKVIATLVLTAILFGTGSDSAKAAGQGHGGGAGHIAGGGFAHGGYGGYGGYRGWGGYGRGWGGGWGWGWGGFGWGLGLGLGLGYGLGYPYYGYGYGYPYYGYGYGPYACGPYAYGGYPYPAYSPGSSPGSGLPPIPVAPMGGPYATPTGAAIPSPPGPLPVADITLVIHTPADAAVWINGIKTNQTGPAREFVSSGLDAGRTYTFDLRAQWTTADGKPKDLNRKVHVLAGERSTIDFTSPSP
jgi:uncharacterized protein (TIGR03000 family)